MVVDGRLRAVTMKRILVVLCLFATLFAGVAMAADVDPEAPPIPVGVSDSHAPEWSKWRAYKALKAWKKVITYDPKCITDTWKGPNVCNYTGVYCSPHPKNRTLEVVSGIDLNGGTLQGQLVPELGLLYEVGIFHLNSNRFQSNIPDTFKDMVTLFELDLSNNWFGGPFPLVLLAIPKLEFLDIRFNQFWGKIPRELFEKKLDAIFVNDNFFEGELPDSFGQSGSSAIVLANNKFQGSIPKSIANLKDSLQEIIALGNQFEGNIPPEIGDLENAHLFDLSSNQLTGRLPSKINDMTALETISLGKNILTGAVTASLCTLGNLTAVILDDNYFIEADPTCVALGSIISLEGNCLPGAEDQKSYEVCAPFYPSPPPPSPPPPSPPPPSPPPPPPCPPGYKLGLKSATCFKLVKDHKTWDEAEFYCRHQSGGHLAAIADWDELKDVGEMCSWTDDSRGCYLGGRKPKPSPASKDWSYPWSPCVKFTNHFWNNDEPDNEGECETCLAIKPGEKHQEYQSGKLAFMLSDVTCDKKLPFICALKRCDDCGCELDDTCETMGDTHASCTSDWDKPVGYKCNCSKGYEEDPAGTCVLKEDDNHN